MFYKSILFISIFFVITGCQTIKNFGSLSSEKTKPLGFVDPAILSQSLIGDTYSAPARCLTKTNSQFNFDLCNVKAEKAMITKCSNLIRSNYNKNRFTRNLAEMKKKVCVNNSINNTV